MKKIPKKKRKVTELYFNEYDGTAEISFCTFSAISLSINSCLILRMNLTSVNKCVTVLSKLPISRFLGLLVIEALIIVLDEAIALEINKIFRLLTS